MAMKSDLIEHPCVICQKPSRSCGHTKVDLRAYYARCRELRQTRAVHPSTPLPRHHRVPASGPNVFTPQPDASQQAVLVKMGDKVVRCRIPGGAPLRSQTPEEYGGEPRPPKGKRGEAGQ